MCLLEFHKTSTLIDPGILRLKVVFQDSKLIRSPNIPQPRKSVLPLSPQFILFPEVTNWALFPIHGVGRNNGCMNAAFKQKRLSFYEKFTSRYFVLR